MRNGGRSFLWTEKTLFFGVFLYVSAVEDFPRILAADQSKAGQQLRIFSCAAQKPTCSAFAATLFPPQYILCLT
jgi:hypothetical protein